MTINTLKIYSFIQRYKKLCLLNIFWFIKIQIYRKTVDSIRLRKFCLLNFIFSSECCSCDCTNTKHGANFVPKPPFSLLQTKYTLKVHCIFDYLLLVVGFLFSQTLIVFASFFVFRFVFSFFVMFLLFVICIWTFHQLYRKY